MAYVTASGTTIGISTTAQVAATDTAAEFAALTYTTVNGVMNLGTFGDTRNLISFAVLGDGRTRKLAGAADAGTLTFQVAFDGLDAGQLAMIAAYDDGSEYAFKVVTNDGQGANPNSEWYFAGPVTSKALNVGENDTVLSMTFNVAVNTAVYADITAAA